MKRQSRFTTKKFMILLILISCISMVLTWEVRERISPVEQSVAYVIVPFQKGVTYFSDWVSDKVEFVKNINQLETMNESLEEEVDQLRYENKLMELDQLELERLQSLYELDQQYADYPKTGARIIGKDPGSWYDVFIIDKGTDDGLEANMVVIAGSGLVGRIVEVGSNYAKVRSIIDDLSSVSAEIIRTQDICTVSGDKELGDSGMAMLEDIEESANIKEGDEVITSNLGDYYPPGILIGTVSSIESDPNKLTKTGVLEPAVDFKHLEEVLVIKSVKETLE